MSSRRGRRAACRSLRRGRRAACRSPGPRSGGRPARCGPVPPGAQRRLGRCGCRSARALEPRAGPPRGPPGGPRFPSGRRAGVASRPTSLGRPLAPRPGPGHRLGRAVTVLVHAGPGRAQTFAAASRRCPMHVFLRSPVLPMFESRWRLLRLCWPLLGRGPSGGGSGPGSPGALVEAGTGSNRGDLTPSCARG